MPHLTLPITPKGPLLDVLVGVSHPRADALRLAGQPVPSPVRVRGLIDTGATCTCLDPSVLIQLALSPTGSVLMMTPSTGRTPHACSQYDISLALTDPASSMTVSSLAVLEAHLAAQGIHALIGRDVLARCLLVYNGAAATFTLSF